MNKYILPVLPAILLSCSCNNNGDSNNGSITAVSTNVIAPPANIAYQVINTYPHDTTSYTEGLFLQGNDLYESSGGTGKARFARIDLTTGKVLQESKINSPNENFFGEGIIIFGDKLYQLTWKSQKAYVYDAKTFKKLKEFDWPHEGWGMTHDNKSLIISTGESNLYYVNPETFAVEKIVGVTDNNGPAGNINELEFVNEYIYANKWQTNNILKINPETGRVEGILDFTDIVNKYNLQSQEGEGATGPEAMNGIAYDSAKNTFLITGQRWPKIFEIKLN
jgi:glutamine cyclotransferase